MVYGAFDEGIMREAYRQLLKSPAGRMELSENAIEVCNELDRFLVERLWPEKKKRQQERQEKEMERKTARQ